MTTATYVQFKLIGGDAFMQPITNEPMVERAIALALAVHCVDPKQCEFIRVVDSPNAPLPDWV